MKLKAIFGAAALAFILAGTAQAQIDVSPVPVLKKTSALPKDWNRTAVFTEIFVRSYKDSNGDGIGDFKGMTSQLDYLRDLGITGIWLMPMNPSQDGDHGYAVNDYRAVNPDYGSMADFQEFLDEAHKRGIGVIIDFVVNHSGSGNALFVEAAKSKISPYRDWYLFADSNPGWYDQSMRGVSGAYWNDPWKPADKVVAGGQGLYYGVFDTTMPDLNLRNRRS
ncbi:oligo-1,6-glucosidase [Asticcacaulis biprosthecium C19]|uniref:Oligo-1,6-glucosidase n=1 Tax=Asticcacaulis biprosthecium C19 TaxID=715226 RepID=F4QTM5_9CAUL|nr:alpha-amylase family glycosyl hydrolase [Asticcacaulis biprosthecium]EGF89175.1 oligo-1,6-glucosidase [Asticcacaulis biprosthecium C19]